MDSSLEDAVRFISVSVQTDPGADRSKLVEEACQRFDLTPLQGEFLINKFILEK